MEKLTSKSLKIGDKVTGSDSSVMYDFDGEIIAETKTMWKVKCFNHRTMGELWDKQEETTQMFYKKNNLNKGFSKLINVGCVTQIFKKE